MTRRFILSTFGVLAIVLVIVGATWKWIYPPESYWSPEQAQALVDAFTEVHQAEDAGAHGPNDPGAADFLAARRRYDTIKDELNQARSARDQTGKYFTIAGLSLLIVTYGLWRFWAPPVDAISR